MSQKTETAGQDLSAGDAGGIGGSSNLVQFTSAAGRTEEVIRRLDDARRELRIGHVGEARDAVARIKAALEGGTADTTTEPQRLAWYRGALRVLEGRILQRSGEAAEADASFASAITLFMQGPAGDKPAWAHLAYGAALYEAGRFDEAREALTQARETGDQSYETFLYLGVLALQDNDLGKARELLQEAVKKEPQAPEGELNLAIALERSGPAAEAGSCYLQAGYRLMEQARQPEAIEAFRIAVRLRPDDREARIALGDAWRLMGKYDEAIAAVEQDSDYPLALGTKGAALLELGRVEDALQVLDRAVALDPNYAFGLAARGQVLHLLGRFAEALESLQRAVALDPGNAIWMAGCGEVLRQLGRFDEALEILDRAIASRPQLAFAHGTRAGILWASGRLEEALTAADRAIELDPKYLFALFVESAVLRRLGRLEQALAALDQAVALDPDDASIHTRRGDTLRRLGRLEEALAALDRAVALDPGNASVHADRGDVLRRLGRLDDALVALDRAVELQAADPFAQALRGDVLLALQRPQDALAALERAIELDPSDAYANARRAQALLVLNRHDEALQAVERTLALGPPPAEEADALVARAEVLRLRGGWQDALASLDRAVQLQPEMAAPHSIRGEVLRILGRLGEAQTALERAVELDPKGAFAVASLGELFRAQGRYREARAKIERALTLTSGQYAWALGTLGLIELGTGEFAAALEAFESSRAQRAAGNLTAHVGKGWSLRLLERLPEAVSVLEQAVASLPDSHNAKVLLGACLLLAGRRGEGEAILHEVAKALESLTQPDPQDLTDLSLAQALVGRYDEAMRSSLDALSIAPQDNWVLFDLALIAMMARRYELGLEEYEKAVREASAYAEPERRRGIALTALRDLEGAARVNDLERDGPLAKAMALLEELAQPSGAMAAGA
ncbi:MAG TPA: tetratricopeptide repeat protein [Thermoanaerobaculia bacterium]|nr:tetratricopeptide repeat protein [Thermoanaerobaculia bacterium]